MFQKIMTQSPKVSVLLKTLDASMLRARTIANNIANVSTPEFKRVEVRFEDQLKLAMDKGRIKGTMTNSKHIDLGRKDLWNVKAHAYKPNDPILASGVNNVDIDTEMSNLAENQLTYSFALKFLKGNYTKINAAIQSKSIQG